MASLVRPASCLSGGGRLPCRFRVTTRGDAFQQVPHALVPGDVDRSRTLSPSVETAAEKAQSPPPRTESGVGEGLFPRPGPGPQNAPPVPAGTVRGPHPACAGPSAVRTAVSTDGNPARFTCALFACLSALLLAGCTATPRTSGTSFGPAGPPGAGIASTQAPVASADPWTLTTTTLDVSYRGTYLGNGTLGQRLMHQGTGWGPEGPLPAFMAGLYEEEHLVTLPSPTAVDLIAGDRHFMGDPRQIRSFRQELSLRAGTLTTDAVWDTGQGALRVVIRTFVARHDPALAQVQLRLRAARPLDLRLVTGGALGGDFEAPQVTAHGDGVELLATTHRGRVPLAQVDRVTARGFAIGRPSVNTDGAASRSLRLPGSGEVVITRIVATLAGDAGGSASDPGRLLDRARQLASRAAAAGDEALFARHRAAWERLWQSDVEIEGAPQDQQAVRSFLFYLLQSARAGGDASIPPMGLSGDAFGGHIFWDAETWIFPALLAFHPDLARPLLEYRFRTLPAARANARAAGCAGASYAWESAANGTEQAPEPFRHGRHVTADVALAVWQYYAATRDRTWLAAHGWPILQATAEYWVSRARPVGKGDRFGITQVTTPDENAGLVNNSAWVNFAARCNLEAAAAAAAALGRPADPRWTRLARGLILTRDPATGLLREHDAYRGLKIKQADTLLLLYPGALQLPKAEKERLYDYYAPRAITAGPAMTDSIHAIVAAALGRPEEAYRQFQASCQPFLRPPFLMFSEKRSRDNLYFLTGAAGSLQAVLYGFGGLRLGDPDCATDDPLLPPAWQSLTLRGVAWQGRRYDRVIRRGQAPRWEVRRG
jgi:trehalose/maltose hydrolase-like predicted phosphorylase